MAARAHIEINGQCAALIRISRDPGVLVLEILQEGPGDTMKALVITAIRQEIIMGALEIIGAHPHREMAAPNPKDLRAAGQIKQVLPNT